MRKKRVKSYVRCDGIRVKSYLRSAPFKMRSHHTGYDREFNKLLLEVQQENLEESGEQVREIDAILSRSLHSNQRTVPLVYQRRADIEYELAGRMLKAGRRSDAKEALKRREMYLALMKKAQKRHVEYIGV